MVYFVLAIAAGVFHREYTKFSGFTGKTVLGNVHTHLLVMGAFLFLIVVYWMPGYSEGFMCYTISPFLLWPLLCWQEE